MTDPPVSRDGYGPTSVHPFTGVLPQLADPAGYTPCSVDYVTDEHFRAYWLDLFAEHMPTMGDHAVEEVVDQGGDVEESAERALSAIRGFLAWLDRCRVDIASVAAEAGQGGRLTMLDVCYERERRWRAAGFDDPYRLAKYRENESALAILPALLARLDAMPVVDRLAAITRGVFAGNIFDLGATQTQAMFRDKRVDFTDTLGRLRARPWLVDDADAWLAAFEKGWGCPLVFVDNAGPDIVLGMLPLVRELLRRCEAVIVAANTFPSLNDVTIDDLSTLVGHAAAIDGELAEARAAGRLVLVGSGNGAPLIDLTRLSPELEALAGSGVGGRAVDLVILEGMGRAVESNYHVPFTTDVLKTCMVKDPGIAEELGGEVFDLVLRFEPAGGQ
ncbi:MAG: ARMT1-like domain-containing protein [Planctomycetota bacterium]